MEQWQSAWVMCVWSAFVCMCVCFPKFLFFTLQSGAAQTWTHTDDWSHTCKTRTGTNSRIYWFGRLCVDQTRQYIVYLAWLIFSSFCNVGSQMLVQMIWLSFPHRQPQLLLLLLLLCHTFTFLQCVWRGWGDVTAASNNFKFEASQVIRFYLKQDVFPPITVAMLRNKSHNLVI